MPGLALEGQDPSAQARTTCRRARAWPVGFTRTQTRDAAGSDCRGIAARGLRLRLQASRFGCSRCFLRPACMRVEVAARGHDYPAQFVACCPVCSANCCAAIARDGAVRAIARWTMKLVLQDSRAAPTTAAPACRASCRLVRGLASRKAHTHTHSNTHCRWPGKATYPPQPAGAEAPDERACRSSKPRLLRAPARRGVGRARPGQQRARASSLAGGRKQLLQLGLEGGVLLPEAPNLVLVRRAGGLALGLLIVFQAREAVVQPG